MTRKNRKNTDKKISDYLQFDQNLRMKRIMLSFCCLLTLTEFTLNAQQITRGPYLQMGTTTGMTIRWRTDVAVAGKVNYGTELGNLAYSAEEGAAATEHIVQIIGLTPATVYYYNAGTTASLKTP